ncbi:MAG: hypothetical protein KME03_18515 [Aphanocapsa lilacina HA4352-LM1]|nr:hypothetical protein [Aphanocapsa lilacina HA4352-LM1]
MRSARVRRERYVGPWLPEPLGHVPADPLQQSELADSLSMAFLVLLENLSPLERAVFLLSDVFEYDHAEIARIVDKSPVNCRQILRRARRHLAERQPRFRSPVRTAKSWWPGSSRPVPAGILRGCLPSSLRKPPWSGTAAAK